MTDRGKGVNTSAAHVTKQKTATSYCPLVRTVLSSCEQTTTGGRWGLYVITSQQSNKCKMPKINESAAKISDDGTNVKLQIQHPLHSYYGYRPVSLLLKTEFCAFCATGSIVYDCILWIIHCPLQKRNWPLPLWPCAPPLFHPHSTHLWLCVWRWSALPGLCARACDGQGLRTVETAGSPRPTVNDKVYSGPNWSLMNWYAIQILTVAHRHRQRGGSTKEVL